MILLDTNILVRLANQNDPDYQATLGGVAGCRKLGRPLAVSDQALQEFWVVATRRVLSNGLEMTAPRAEQFLKQFTRMFIRLADHPRLFEQWRSLVNAHAITGIKAYDARLAAFVLVHGLQAIMTYNRPDFAKFSVNIVDPKNPTTW